ncbi:MAG: hypothetical protein ABSA77_05865, partial [Thermoguttaceae bacterium]
MSTLLLMVGISLLSAGTSQAASNSYVWDQAGGPAGTWDLITSNWYDSVSGLDILWPNATASPYSDAVFGTGHLPNNFGAGGAVTVDTSGGAVNVESMTFNLAGYNVTGGDLTLAGTPVITSTQSATISSNIITGSTVSLVTTSDLTISGRLYKATSGLTVTKTGNGTLTLSGAGDNSNNTVVLSAGTLVLGKDSSSTVHAATQINSSAANTLIQFAGTGGDQIGGNARLGYNASNAIAGNVDMNGRSEAVTL